MKSKLIPLIEILICEAVALPLMYFVVSHSLLATVIVGVVIATLILLVHFAASKGSRRMQAAYEKKHPDAAVLYCQPSEYYIKGSAVKGTLLVTKTGVVFLIRDVSGILETNIRWNEIRSYRCGVLLELTMKKDDTLNCFKLYESKQVDALLAEHVQRAPQEK